jgi:D-serine deaminase-like pyridoxal phosphate-dependent protein
VAGRDDLVLDRMSEEHGVLVAPGGQTLLRICDRVVVIPVHCCTTVNLHPSLLMVGTGEAVWDPVSARGWREGASRPA